MTQHTPGPWRSTVAPCGTRTALMSLGNGRPVAMLGITSALNPADVALIAAAPDLLRLLRDVLDAYLSEASERDGIAERFHGLTTEAAVLLSSLGVTRPGGQSS